MASISASTARVPAPTPARVEPGAPAPLEPTTPHPTREAGPTTVGDRLRGGLTGAGLGALIGLVPAFLGAVGVEALSKNGTGATAAFFAILGASTLWFTKGGLTEGADGFRQRRQKSFDDEHGVTTLQAARREIATYDSSGNGSIELSNPSGLASKDERVKNTRSGKVSSAARFEAADVDPKDGVVTDRELATLMSRFDADRNGVLTNAERGEFDAAYPVER